MEGFLQFLNGDVEAFSQPFDFGVYLFVGDLYSELVGEPVEYQTACDVENGDRHQFVNELLLVYLFGVYSVSLEFLESLP